MKTKPLSPYSFALNMSSNRRYTQYIINARTLRLKEKNKKLKEVL